MMSNIAEGHQRIGLAEYLHFLAIAKASNAEVRSLLYVLLDAEYINAAEFESVYASADEVGRIVGGLRTALQKKEEACMINFNLPILQTQCSFLVPDETLPPNLEPRSSFLVPAGFFPPNLEPRSSFLVPDETLPPNLEPRSSFLVPKVLRP